MDGRADTAERDRTSTGRPAGFGALLKRYRVARHLSQEALAERAGLSTDAIGALESGRRQAPYRDTVARLALALDLAAADRAALEAAVRRRRGPAATGGRPGGHNLPAPPTALVGRAAEVAHGVALLRGAEVRLLTLTGPGGVGKTRLAWQIAHELVADAADCPDGVWLVELAPLGDPTLVLPTLARALGLREAPGTPLLATVTAFLAAKHLLLVLDNCEHLIAACAGLAAALLRACPSLRLLATSRAGLAIPGETRVRVPPLPFPDPDHLPPPAALPGYAAVALLLQRARAQGTPLALTAQTAPAVARICARLDGLPLALELAAARLAALSPAQVADRLDDCFRLLGGGSRGVEPRQRTLEATVAWSYGLLAPEEQTLFARLAVFAGGWDLAAAAAVGASAAADLPDLLARLVDQSLVVVEAAADGALRYRLPETLRQYGRGQLAAAGETARMRRGHAAHYLALAEQADRGLIGPDQRRWFDRLEREQDNVRAALAWGLEPDAEQAKDALSAQVLGLRLAGHLRWFWLFHDHHREGLAWLDRAVAHGAAAPAAVRARALFTAGVLVGFLNDPVRSRALLARSVALCREGDDRRELAVALATFGWALWRGGEERLAAAAQAEALALARALGEPWPIAYALMHGVFRVANGAAGGRAEERARALLAGDEARRLFRMVGDGLNSAVLQSHLGQIALSEGDYARARAAFVACLPALRAFGWRSAVAETLIRLAGVARAQHDAREADHLTAALALYRQLGDQWLPVVAWVRSRLADLALTRGAWAAAATHAAASLVIIRDTSQGAGAERANAPEVRAALAAVEPAGLPPSAATVLRGALEVAAALAAQHGAPLRAMRLAGAAAQTERNRPPPAAEVITLARRLAPARHLLSAEEQAHGWAEGQGLTPEQSLAEALTALQTRAARRRRA